VTVTICVLLLYFTFFLTAAAHTHTYTRTLIMPSRSAKKYAGPSLYKIFIDAYMKAHPNVKRAIKYHDAQVEWNEIKLNEECVKEKLEEYLEIYNQLAASSEQHSSLPDNSDEKPKNRRRPSKRTRTDSNEQNEDNEESNGLDNLDNDDEEEAAKKKKEKKIYPMTYPIKIRKTS